MELKGKLESAEDNLVLNFGGTDQLTLQTSNTASITVSLPATAVLLAGVSTGGDDTKVAQFDTSGATTGTTFSIETFNDATKSVQIPNVPDNEELITETATQTMVSKTLTAPLITTGGTIDVTLTGSITLFETADVINIGGGGNTTNINIGDASTTTTIPGTVVMSGLSASFADPNLTLNDGGNDASAEGGGLTIERTGTDGSLVYEDALTSKWKLGALGSEVEVADVSSSQTIDAKVLSVSSAANNRFVDAATPTKRLFLDLSASSASQDHVLALTATTAKTYDLPAGAAATQALVSEDADQILTNKDLTDPELTNQGAGTGKITLTHNNADNTDRTLRLNISGSTPVLTLSTDFTVSNGDLSLQAQPAGTTAIFPWTTSQTVVGETQDQTLTKKELTSPTITAGGSINLETSGTIALFDLATSITMGTTGTTNTITMGDSGTTITLDGTLNVADNNLTLNSGGDDASSVGGGITLERTGADGTILYDAALASKWKLGAAGAEEEVLTTDHIQTFTQKSITVANSGSACRFIDEVTASKVLRLNLAASSAAQTHVLALTSTTAKTYNLPDGAAATQVLVSEDDTNVLTNKTLTSPLLTAATNFDVTGAGAVTLFGSLGANTLTLAGASSTVDVPGDITTTKIAVTDTSTAAVATFDNNSAATTVATVTATSDSATAPAAEFTQTTATANAPSLTLTRGGVGSIDITVPTGLTADYELRLPVDDGLANQVLTTDGSGVLSWSAGGGGGGGGGGGFTWNPVTGDAPIEDEENNELVYLFSEGLNQKLAVFLKVPNGYTPGTQVTMRIAAYTPVTSNEYAFTVSTGLVRDGQDAIDGPISTGSDVVNFTISATVNRLDIHQFDITNGSGQIGGQAISANDIITVELERTAASGTDTPATVKVIPSATEVNFS